MNKSNDIFANRIVIEQRIQETFEDIKFQLAENKTEKVITTLTEIVKGKNKDFQNQLILIQSRYNSWTTQDIMGTNPPQSEFSKIVKSLLDIVDRIEADFNSKKNNWNKLDDLLNVILESKSVLEKIRPSLENEMGKEKSILGRIWIALLPQLEGTLTTICKIISEIIYIGKITEFKNETNKKYGKDVISLKVPDFTHFISNQDINSVESLYKSLDETVSINSIRVGRNELCPCGSGKKYRFCHGQK